MLTHLIWLGLWLIADNPQAPGLPGVTPEERRAFEAEEVEANKDPGRLIKLGLWAESKGLVPERDSLLVKATELAPKLEAARGLLGQVSHAGAWRSPKEVVLAVRDDARRAARMAEYNLYRDELDRAEEADRAAEKSAQTKITALERTGRAAPAAKIREDRAIARSILDRQLAVDHIRIGEWCEAYGMRPEAMAHYTSATLFDPYSDDGWRHLGYVQHNGRWMSREQIVAEQKEATAQHQADRHWAPLLAHRKAKLENATDREEAERKLGTIDPHAVPSIIRVFVTAKQKDQEEAVRLFGRIDSPASSHELAVLAVRSDFEPVRHAAIEALKGRDPRDYAEPLVKTIKSHWIYRFVPVNGPGTTGMLEVDTPRFHLTRTYDAPVPFTLGKHFRGYVGIDANGLPVVMNGHELSKTQGQSRRSEEALEAAEIRTAQIFAAAQFKAESARAQMVSDVKEIRSNNASASAINPRIIQILHEVLDAPEALGDDEDAWNLWYFEKIGYRYTPPPKVTVKQSYPNPPAPGFTSCFAADTPVRTIDGPRMIQSLRVGDRVLAQDVTTGGLSFQPILALHHNPPDTTVKVALEEGDPIVASRFHRFWIAGQGWKMARDLVAGDMVRTLGGVSRVKRVEPGPLIPVYNLDVAGARTFFAGTRDALVHDNTMPARVVVPFDARADLAGVGSPRP